MSDERYVASPNVVSLKGLKLSEWLARLQERGRRLEDLICRLLDADYVQVVHVSGGERLFILVHIVRDELHLEKCWMCSASLDDEHVVAFVKDRVGGVTWATS